MTIIREPLVAAPQITVTPSGILDHATVSDSSAIGWRTKDGLFPSWNCLDTVVPTTICPATPAVEKDFSEHDWAPGFEFSVYGGTVCRLVGYDRQEAAAGLQAAFLANESKGVEQALLGTRFVATGSGESPAWNGAVDLTPTSGVVSPAVGLAILEGFAGQNYAGVPTIHMPRTVASLLATDEGLVMMDQRLFSRLGSKVVNGAGYEPSTGPTGVAPAAGEYWMYATGEVVVERGPVESHEGIDWVNNEDFLLVERSYIVAVDCFTAAVRVEVFA